MDDRDLLRYSRHILLDEIGIEGQQRLAAATVLVVGCGGLGAAALPFLAASGVGRLILADDDDIDETNLQRQTAFCEADIGRNKAQTLANRLNGINGRCRTLALPYRLQAADLAGWAARAHAVLDCSDNFATRRALNRACVQTRTPFVSGAAARFSGQLAVYRPDLAHAPCYNCLFDEGVGDAGEGECALFGVFSPLVGIIGAMQAAEALKILAEIGRPAHGVLHTYDALTGRWQAFGFAKNPGCAVCGGATSHTDT
ncbi:MAG: HesA/MoeB/ThiF family protein [Neisseria sp.]|nr:HesA/MoeB/ThiF family protein [Neisseria sp.]